MAGENRKLVRALGHELRFEILSILNQRAASPLELQSELGEGLRTVSYHLNVLRECDCVELVGAQAGDQSVERLYKATRPSLLSAEQMGQIPAHHKERITDRWIGHVFEALSKAQEDGTLDARDDRHLSATPLVLDERGWSELMKASDEFLDCVLAIREDSARRLEDEGDAGIPAMVTIMGYEMPEVYEIRRARARSRRGS